MNPLTQSKNATILPILIALTLGCFGVSPQARAVSGNDTVNHHIWQPVGTLYNGAIYATAKVTVLSESKQLFFEDRVAYQRAIEEVYWRHRIWPKEQRTPKPSFDAVMSQARLEKKVADYLRNSQALEDYWQLPLTAEDLQAEMDRMARNTKRPEVLRELFEALGNDPFVIAECLAKPLLAERLITSFSQAQRKGRLTLLKVGANSQTRKVVLANTIYTLPTISYATTGCPDTWANTNISNAPAARHFHTAVWTGSEMIVWGGDYVSGVVVYLNTGGRYNPDTDSWSATSTTNAPAARIAHTAVWTGSEMIVWGGYTSGPTFFNTGSRYNPSTDSWTATSTTKAPDGRNAHTAVWTGSEMIVWGGAISLPAPRSLTPVGDTILAATRGQPPAPPTRPMPGTLTRQYGPAAK